MSNGKIVQIIGAVVDVEFPSDNLPKVFDALLVEDTGLTLEVQQQMGDGVVRCIAMGASEGLKRGLSVKGTGAGISVPVGQATLGRVMDVMGRPIDEAGPIGEEMRMPIHRKAPTYADQVGGNDILETGIKVIDLICPFARGGKVGLFGGAGVGKTVLIQELINNMGDLTTLTSKGADNLEKSLESLQEKDLTIRRLQDAVTRRDSVNLSLLALRLGVTQSQTDTPLLTQEIRRSK